MATGRALIVGAGVVGSATAHVLRAAGMEVFAFDSRADALEDFPGIPWSGRPDDGPIGLAVICVPTPPAAGRLSLAEVESALAFVLEDDRLLAEGALVAIRSTLMPGDTALVTARVLGLLERRRASVCYWPCFARERWAVSDELDPTVVVFGARDEAAVRRTLGGWLDDLRCPVHFLTPQGAELAKAAANAWNATKISFFNALGDWASALEAGTPQPIADVVALAAEGSWAPDYGTRVGPAFAGACLPKDLDALIATLSRHAAPHSALLEAVRSVNQFESRSAPDEHR